MKPAPSRLALLVGTWAAALALVALGTGAQGAPVRAVAAKTLVFGTTGDPVVLDGALVSDDDSLRVVGQIFEGLVGLKPRTTKVVPLLATGWKHDRSGKVWTFTLRKGVRFQDGTAFNAGAVCANFSRWYKFSGPFQLSGVTYYWQLIFKGFRRNESADLPQSLFRGCTVKNPHKAVIRLSRPLGAFLPALALPAFSIASPTALKKYGANQAQIRNGVFELTGTYGYRHPTGTGPFELKSWVVGKKLVLVRNQTYWGKKPKLAKVVFRPIARTADRLQALRAGAIMGYDGVAPGSYGAIRKNSRLKLLRRPAFNVAYLTLHQGPGSSMDELKVRQAVAYALDRKPIRALYPPGSVAAKEFVPQLVPGYAKTGVASYSYDPEKAKRLLDASSCHRPCKVDFWYPSSVPEANIPSPKRIFDSMANDLEQVGFDVVAHTAPWREYAKRVGDGDAGDLNLAWKQGTYADADDFLDVFTAYSDQFGFRSSRIFKLLKRADSEFHAAKRVKLYQKANRLLMDSLPGVPYVHAGSALGFERIVKGFVPSLTSHDSFSTVSIG